MWRWEWACRRRERVRINTHALFEDFVRERGLDFAPLAGDPRDGMEAYTTELIGASTVRFFQLFGLWLKSIVEQVLDDIWNACQDADALLFSPLGLPAYHVAQKRGVPVCGAFYLPMWHPTRRFASLSAPALPSPVGIYNLLTHYIGRLTILQSFRQPLNDWLQERLGLERLPLLRWPYDHLNGRPMPALYGYSPTVLPRPPEWNEHVYVTGYWFLDTPREWQPPRDLLDFLESGSPPVYVGFGSLIEKDPGAVIELVVRALAQAGQRGILLANRASLSPSDLPITSSQSSRSLTTGCSHAWRRSCITAGRGQPQPGCARVCLRSLSPISSTSPSGASACRRCAPGRSSRARG
jgi:UDP:flavonoid glycosyltransferase YjiC (YdhE family)